MSFYLKPPKGEANLHLLLECVQQRLICFVNLQKAVDATVTEKFEYLVEDSILDRTSHFIFRLGVLAGSIPRNVFLNNELQLLKQRLNWYDKEDMEFFLKNIVRQLRDCIRLNIDRQLSDFYWTLYNIVCKMLQKGYLSHIYRNHVGDFEDMNESLCNKGFCIQVPFHYCNKLIATRKVELINGNALIECYNWMEILPTLFVSYLKIALNEMKYNINVASTISDDRIAGCLRILSTHYFKNEDACVSGIRLKELAEESIYFPLCMKNLYGSLMKNHRLAHNDRFDLGVFLKGIGLSLSDSIKFWQGEYMKPHSSCSKCSHSWQANEKKYIYGIRHLYGLEGAGRNYSVRSCRNIQEAGIGINCEGGCPFVHYDDDFLRLALKKYLPDFDDDIEVIIYERKENPNFSCKLFSDCILRRMNREVLPENVTFESPLQYYNKIKCKKSDKS